MLMLGRLGPNWPDSVKPGWSLATGPAVYNEAHSRCRSRSKMLKPAVSQSPHTSHPCATHCRRCCHPCDVSLMLAYVQTCVAACRVQGEAGSGTAREFASTVLPYLRTMSTMSASLEATSYLPARLPSIFPALCAEQGKQLVVQMRTTAAGKPVSQPCRATQHHVQHAWEHWCSEAQFADHWTCICNFAGLTGKHAVWCHVT